MKTESSSESKADSRLLVGECECGTVRYKVADAFLYAMNCHCSRCRAATGSAFKAFAGIEREKLEITDGQDRLLVFGEEDLNHTRCGACGSLLFSVVREGAYVHVALVHGAGNARREAAQRPDEPGMGNAHRQLHRPRRPYLGDRAGALSA